MKIRLSFVLLIVGMLGCSSHPIRNFPALGHVTTINVTDQDASGLSSSITDSAKISQITAFVDSHRSGWYQPWYGVPVPRVSVEFHNGTELEGSFGVGKNFLETQRDGNFYSQDATSDEVDGFLTLLGPTSNSPPKAEKENDLDGDFKILTRVEQLPESVKTAFAALMHQPQFEMADPGRDFQVTDVITHQGLPRRRLIFAGLSDRECFIHYETGGRGHSFDLVVFSNAPSGATLVWSGR